jgi:hypothetical protein
MMRLLRTAFLTLLSELRYGGPAFGGALGRTFTRRRSWTRGFKHEQSYYLHKRHEDISSVYTRSAKASSTKAP